MDYNNIICGKGKVRTLTTLQPGLVHSIPLCFSSYIIQLKDIAQGKLNEFERVHYYDTHQ
jgi:hypothetical protein